MTTAVVTDSGDVWNRNRTWAACILIAVAAVLPYVPTFMQPFVSDDYLQIALGRQYGPVDRWPALAADPLYRCRATSIVLTHWTEVIGGVSPRVFYSTSIVLHVLNSLLLFGVIRSLRFAPLVAAVAAAFFGVYQGHQEAVMWYAALPELLLFLFSILLIWLWTRFLRADGWRSAGYWVAGLLTYVLALLSKEAAVTVVPLALGLAFWEQKLRRGVLGSVPLGLIALIYAAGIFVNKPVHLHLNDGTFSLTAPFYVTWINSMGRLLWIWGALSLLWLAASRALRLQYRVVLAGLLWAGITLLPFSFLTYMPRVPSRHVYLPSAGLALIVAAGFVSFRHRFSRYQYAAPLLAMLIVTHHTGYVWIRKRVQFLERAEPTERLLAMARSGKTAIYIHCFPYGPEIAERALEVMMSERTVRLIWKQAGAPDNSQAMLCTLKHPPGWESAAIKEKGDPPPAN
ncbi:MAG: hypothetical protein IT168_00905 [Bryobacterales bacterium]|nr:hypothetical protein [Bryobacterales bacterium]